jgi:molybdate transport system substrate-binding protein
MGVADRWEFEFVAINIMRREEMQSLIRLALVVVTAGAFSLTAKADEDILILCGSSFRPPMEKLVEMYEKETGIRPLMSFGGSEDHLPHVKTKRAGDLYVTHTPYMQYTKEADALLREVQVGYLAPALVVRKGISKKVRKIEDLAQPGLKVVLPNPDYSTCGEMVDGLLTKKKIKDAVQKNVGSALMKHHSEIGNHLKLGSREAGIMWNGVAHNYLDAIDVVPTEYEYDEEIRVAVMGLSYTKHKAAVEKFLDFVEKHGRKVFADFGYKK